MGGPMGVYEGYDTDICQDGGKFCVARDNEGYYGVGLYAGMSAGDAMAAGIKCPPAFDCEGVPPSMWNANDGISAGIGSNPP
mmetsp:Transcript_1378/g.2436  ORF Transcript_1378/g.2436 Transcript_1378/m.2436 type:complete len:82 (+) Transcript_1378:152-397(+)|eukprot:CAMPEP_0196719086 /NCGR_PEP_ID=MMETSP1091-20130531/2153_1 /TAXON_ID=302021 /ORGANISM="Rhodomonas sp., Strain CCMP768" /LENGTH=81 /DNA_ID=CAMNT_0042059945 /DNA_START=161 /DNA_END=406 /DNA_ORIENTATION=+